MSARKPAMVDAPLYRIRVTVAESDPEIWRLLEVSGGLTLAQLHQVIQVSVGWRGSHLHLFVSADGRRWLDQRSLDEALEGGLEDDAVLAHVLSEESGPLTYEYDFGDSWDHLIELIEVLPPEPAAPRARLIRGERRGPLEDSGGIGGYQELLAILADPRHDRHVSAQDWVEATLGPWQGPFDPERLDADAVNRALCRLFDSATGQREARVTALETLVSGMFPVLRPEFLAYAGQAQLERSVLIDSSVAAQMVRPYTLVAAPDRQLPSGGPDVAGQQPAAQCHPPRPAAQGQGPAAADVRRRGSWAMTRRRCGGISPTGG